MTIELDANNLVIHDKLDKEEAKVFCKFLLVELSRHEDDIRKILGTIAFLENKYKIPLISDQL